MGDHDHGPAATVGLELAQELLLGRRVQGARGFIEDQDARIADQRPGDADELALARRQTEAAFAELGVVALRQALDEIVGADELGDRHDSAGILVGDSHGNVLAHRTGEELDILRHAADLGAQLRGREVGDVGPVDQHPTCSRPEQALHEIGDGGLARA